MAERIAINGTKLDEVRMLMEPYNNGTISYITYPSSQFRLSDDDHRIRLAVPAYLAVELYRSGILPQDKNTPIEMSIGGCSVGWYIVSDMRYPHHSDGPFPQINFTFSRVRQSSLRDVSGSPVLSHSTRTETPTFVTDITHYLDESGELMALPGPARKLASFLTLIIEAATTFSSATEHDSGIRCRIRTCRGIIRTVVLPNDDEISWRCPGCGHTGVIRSWQNTKWNQRKRTGELG